MPKRMLIDAKPCHRKKPGWSYSTVISVEEFDFESASRRPLKGEISYLAKVTRVENRRSRPPLSSMAGIARAFWPFLKFIRIIIKFRSPTGRRCSLPKHNA